MILSISGTTLTFVETLSGNSINLEFYRSQVVSIDALNDLIGRVCYGFLYSNSKPISGWIQNSATLNFSTQLKLSKWHFERYINTLKHSTFCYFSLHIFITESIGLKFIVASDSYKILYIKKRGLINRLTDTQRQCACDSFCVSIISFVKWSQLQCPYHNYLYSQPQCLSWGKPCWGFRPPPGCPHHCSNLEFFWGWQQPSWVVSLSCRSQSVSSVKQ